MGFTYNENLKKKRKEISKKKLIAKPTKEICPDCGANLLIRISKFGEFYACSNFPKCRYKKDIPKSLNVKCPKCKKGEIVERRTRLRQGKGLQAKKQKIFYGCSLWPDCDFASWEKLIGKNCPKCNSPLVITKWKKVKCSNKDCQ